MAKCKDCGVKLEWVKVNGKWQPTTDGKAHWEVCKAKAVFRTLRGPKEVGEKYKTSCGECSVPPWEECKCSALLAEG
jgi:uncharacterized OB-fold protein